MKRVLVAGGCGFLGSHLVELLVGAGNEVTVVDNLSSGRFSNIEELGNRIRFVEADIEELVGLDNFEIIVNLASRASRMEWEKYPLEVCTTNSVGQNNLLRLAHRNGARYVYTSTSEVYGNPDTIPTPETYVGRVDPAGSRAPYDESKRFGETLLLSYVRETGLNATVARVFNTYGPRMRGGDLYGRVIDRFIQQALTSEPLTVYGDGTQTRSFAYVDDTVRGLVSLIEHGKAGEVYNIGSDVETRIIDIAHLVRRLTGSSSEIEFHRLPPDDPKRRLPEITKIRSLGWTPTVPLDEGLERTIGAMKV